MRPLRLEMKGFSAFREPTVVDFDGAGLVALVGPTGAGKSTIIDGIGFALYGSVSRYKNASLVAPIINQLSNEARVRLDFSIGGTEFTAVRVVRRTATGATTREARLESGDRVLAGTASELDAAVEQLLGLDFEQFTKTAVLPQGEFARFLTETSGDRQGLLRRLLGMDMYRRMGIAARERARIAGSQRDALAEQSDPVTDEELAALTDRSLALERLEPVLCRLVDELSSAEATMAEAEANIEQNESAITRLAAVEVPHDAQDLARELSAARKGRTRARGAVEKAREELAAAESAARLSGSVHELEKTLDSLTDRAALAEEIAVLEPQLDAAVPEAARTRELREEAESALESLADRLGDVRILAGASGLVASLTVGEACPVCRQTVASVPDHDINAEIMSARADHVAARETRDRAVAEERAAQVHLERTRTKLERLGARAAILADSLAGKPDEDALERAIADARAAESLLDTARSNAERVLDELRLTEAALETTEARALELRRVFTSTRDRLADFDPPAPGESDIGSDWKDLRRWARTSATERRAQRKGLATSRRSARQLVQAKGEEILSLTSRFVDDRVADPQTWLAAERGRVEAELTAAHSRRDHQAKTAARIAELSAESAVATELGRLLAVTGFEQWLMVDVLHELAQRATDRLRELSGGAYSLISDGADFRICDHRNADETRGARTLSGGETFLTSLSLALALAETISELATDDGAPAIESIFLDEGFGMLDTETLDVVAVAIEELGASGRMVGVVTHVRELAERISTRFEVRRTSTTSTVTRIET